MLSLLAALAALQTPSEPATPPGALVVQDAAFVPLRRAERIYSRLGPVGPYYPEAAVQAGQDGEAILDCLAMADGALTRCKVVSETPRGYNFGVAARIMADRGRIVAGSPVTGAQTLRVRVPFTRGAPVTVTPKPVK